MVSIAQSKHQLTSRRETVGIGTHKYDEPWIITELHRVSSSTDKASVPNAQVPSASGLTGHGDDCEIAELQWQNTMWKALNAESRKRSKISSALGKLRSTTAWQKAPLLDKIRMNILEICRVSSFARRGPSTLSKHCNGAPLYEITSKTTSRRLSRNTENNFHRASHEERQWNSQTYANEQSFTLQEVRKTPSELVEICPLSEKRKSDVRSITGVLKDFTKSLEMTIDAYGDVSTTIEEVIEAGSN